MTRHLLSLAALVLSLVVLGFVMLGNHPVIPESAITESPMLRACMAEKRVRDGWDEKAAVEGMDTAQMAPKRAQIDSHSKDGGDLAPEPQTLP